MNVYLSTKQLAERFPYSPWTIKSMIRDGEFTEIKAFGPDREPVGEGEYFKLDSGRVVFVWSRAEAWLLRKGGFFDNAQQEPMTEAERRGLKLARGCRT